MINLYVKPFFDTFKIFVNNVMRYLYTNFPTKNLKVIFVLFQTLPTFSVSNEVSGFLREDNSKW